MTQACGEVLKEVCTNVCLDEENVDKACGGTVLRCLADKIDDITDDECKSELLYFQKMEVGSMLTPLHQILLLVLHHVAKKGIAVLLPDLIRCSHQ